MCQCPRLLMCEYKCVRCIGETLLSLFLYHFGTRVADGRWGMSVTASVQTLDSSVPPHTHNLHKIHMATHLKYAHANKRTL